MSQINKYADKAAYESDTARLRTLSSESYIENDGVLLYDGVNAVIPKSAAGVGDLVVFDKTEGVLKFIKGATLVADKMPAELVPAGVVYGRHGDKVRIVSLENATFNGSDEMRWANSYEVALSGFDLAAGGTAVLTFGTGIYKVDLPLTWGAGAKLSDIHAQINSFVTGQIKDYGWASSVDEANSRIIMSSNTWSPVFSTIGVVSGCQITRPPEDVDYQTTLTGALIEGEKEYIRRNNGVDISFAGCNYKMFMRTIPCMELKKTDSSREAAILSAKAFSPRPTTRRWLRPMRPTGTTCSANIWPNIRRPMVQWCATAG